MIFALHTDKTGCRPRYWSGDIVRSGVQRFVVPIDADAATHFECVWFGRPLRLGSQIYVYGSYYEFTS